MRPFQLIMINLHIREQMTQDQRFVQKKSFQ